MPGALNFNSDGFAATKAAFMSALTEDKVDEKSGQTKVAKFTEEDVVGMVVRNPNLIGIRPTGYGGADTSDESTVKKRYFSVSVFCIFIRAQEKATRVLLCCAVLFFFFYSSKPLVNYLLSP